MAERPKIYANVDVDQFRRVRRAAELRGETVAAFVRTVVMAEAEEEIDSHVKAAAARAL